MKKIWQLLFKVIEPKSKNEDRARQEYILNILLVTIILLVSIGLTIILYRLAFLHLNNYESNSLPLIFVSIILSFFLFLYFLSRKGYSRFASFIFLSVIFLIAAYMGYKWGIDLPAEILFFVLVIVMAGILIGTMPAFMATLLVFLTFMYLSYLQKNMIAPANRSWINEPWGNSDIVMTSIILFIIATVSWLFNHELKKSFRRVKKSEADLKNERDLLETRVEEKTKELKVTQAKEIAQVYRFAEFGRLSGGLFHDLVNPLTTVMLNVNKIKNDGENHHDFDFLKSDLEQVIKASEKMREFINSVRRQISPQGKRENFCLNQEIEEAIQVLNYKARKNQVQLIFSADEKITTNGDSVKFSQIATNLISNAIDSYSGQENKEKNVKVNLEKQPGQIVMTVSDHGKGMDSETVGKIFEPFFTTKIDGNNLGLGLSLIKKFIEEDFSGKIDVSSQPEEGATFTVTFPLQ